jgi:cell division protein FtsL
LSRAGELGEEFYIFRSGEKEIGSVGQVEKLTLMMVVTIANVMMMVIVSIITIDLSPKH